MKCVIIESPFAGAVPRNLAYLRACMADSLARGEAPYASHGLYTQEGVLDDTIPAERAKGMAAGFAWNGRADATVVYQDFGISSGMAAGIEDARKAGRFIEYRRLSPALVNIISRVSQSPPGSVTACRVCGKGIQTIPPQCMKCPRPPER